MVRRKPGRPGRRGVVAALGAAVLALGIGGAHGQAELGRGNNTSALDPV